MVSLPSLFLAVPRISGSERRERGLGLAGRNYLRAATTHHSLFLTMEGKRPEAGSRPSSHSIGATRNADGSPRYYDGFTWMYNSTAAPTTYSHTELTYNILDQDNIARGHSAYYLRWTDEAIQDGGRAYYDAGKQTLADIPAGALSLRSEAFNMAAKAEAAFAKWDFVSAVFASQAGYRAAAAYRDLARGLPPGTTELERGTKKTGAESCPSAKK
jgi:hypothetical protein